MPRQCRILLIGGSGKRAEAAVFPSVLAMRDLDPEFEIRITAICDPLDPWSRLDHPQLRRVLELDRPEWIAATGEPGADCDALDHFLQTQAIDLAILSSGPTTHLAYSRWAVRRGIPVICDKPPHVVSGAASDSLAAAQILPEYDAFLAEFAARRREISGLGGAVTLSRRAWPPVRNLFSLGKTAQQLFGQGITQFHVILNNGIHRFPEELADPGAHGFLSGVGLLTHSAYHYIDLAAALLEQFPPAGMASQSFALGYVQRLEDSIQTGSANPLRSLCGDQASAQPALSEAAWGCEQSVHAHLTLRSRERRALGYYCFSFNNSTFTPRQFPSRPGVHNPDNLGMRMAQLIIDVHFGALANVRIQQNHLAGDPPSIHESIRLHPRLAESTKVVPGDQTYAGEAFKPTAKGGLFRENVLEALGIAQDVEWRGSLVDFAAHRSTVALFSQFYVALAHEAASRKMPPAVSHLTSAFG
jgi:predicted dehydrogenase